MTPAARAIIEDVAKECRLKPEQFIGQNTRNGPHLVRARIKVAVRLKALGYSGHKIAGIIGRDNATILFYLGRLRQKPKCLEEVQA